MRIALVGPTQSGKSSLLAAVAQASGSHLDLHRPNEPHLAVVKVPDERLAWLTEHYKPRKSTPAEVELLDVPGLNLSDEPGRTHAKAHWPALRNSDMLVFVVRSFASDTVAPYRGRIDPQADLRELLAEMNFADLEQAAGRIAKLQAALHKPTPKAAEQAKELELMQRLQQALEQDRPVAEAVRNPEEDKLLRSFAFLSAKPALAVLNCSESEAAADGPGELCGLPCLQLSAEIEAELSHLPPAERGEFMADLGLRALAQERLLPLCVRRMDRVTFFTVVGEECRAWTVPAGTDAVTAAGVIHSDMARGFIRAETVAFEDLRAAGDVKAARAVGKVRLEGKSYVLHDGEVIHFRFNV
jgi:GTP-binding protein YchF